MKDTNDLYVTDAHNIVVPPPVLMTVAPLDWLDQLTTATARVAKLERANAGHHTLEDTQVEIIHDLQEKLQQANAKAGHHALGDVQIENIADDYENAYRFVADERDALQTRIDAMLTKIEDERKASVIRYRGFPNAISTAIERLDAIANAGEESTK